MKVVKMLALGTSCLYPPPSLPYSFLLEAELNLEPKCSHKDYVNKKIPMPSGIEHATFWSVVQYLTNCATVCPTQETTIN
jgi:hypothetical protein